MTLDEALKAFDAEEFYEATVANQVQVDERLEALMDCVERCPAIGTLAIGSLAAGKADANHTSEILSGALLTLAHLCRMAEIAEMEGDLSTKESDE